MAKGRTELGRRGEQISAAALSSHGYTIVERNWHCADGEIDLVATRDAAWYFVEVRTRRGERYGTPEESLTSSKQAHMEAAARNYLGHAEIGGDPSWHISFVAVKLDYRGNVQRLDFYPTLMAEPIDLMRRCT